jgi:S1-C subfamily serine protease
MFTLRNLRAALVVIVCLFPGTRPDGFAGEAIDAQKLYRQTVPGTVLVVARSGQGSGWIQGSGWVIDQDRRLVLTNYHVVANDDTPLVLFPEIRDNRVISERGYCLQQKNYLTSAVVLRDADRDLAVVSLPRLPAGVAALALAPDPAVPGQRVHAIGNPSASPALWVYSTGSVRQVFTTPANAKERAGVRIVAIQLPLNPGDSGAPIFDDQGRIIGVSVAVAKNANLVSLAIDVREVRVLYQRYLQATDDDAARDGPMRRELRLIRP